MHTKIRRRLNRQNLRIMTLATLCVAGAFVTGIRSAGEVHPFDATLAQQAILEQQTHDGDVDGNGVTNVDDAIALVSIINDGTERTAQALHGDMDGDGSLTLNDLLQLLTRVAHP
ncbi:MAG: dockerin type I domain-containing protein [Candidatus Peribacteraceae bacterium]|jgi:hypothetical protein